MKKIKIVRKIVLISLFTLLLAYFATTKIDNTKTAENIYNDSIYKILEIKSFTNQIESFGSACIISKNEVITNFHVISFRKNNELKIHENIKVRFLT